MKRFYLFFLIAATLFTTCACGTKETVVPEIPDTTPKKIMRTPVYLQNPAEDAMTVMWITNLPCRSWVEYGTDPENMKKTACAWDEGIMVANNKINKIVLEGLEPGTKYYYRACSQHIKHYGSYKKEFGETVCTDVKSFTTWSPDMTDFTVLVVNDTHKKTDIFDRLIKLMMGEKYDLVVFNGDCFDDPEQESDVVEVLAKYCESYGSDTVPSIFMRGNHETRGAWSMLLWDYLAKAGEHSYTAFSMGDTRFVLLDCGEDKPDDNSAYYDMNDFTQYRKDQADFLSREIPSEAFTGASKRVLIHHIPIYAAAVASFNPCKELWQPYLANAPFDVALNGHLHSYRFVEKGSFDNNFPAVIGGGYKEDNATLMVLRKKGDEMGLKVLHIKGNTLLTLAF